MLGAIIGDIAGSRFEWHNHKSKEFELLTHVGGCKPTDDTIMSLAVAQALLESDAQGCLSDRAVRNMQKLGRKYPGAGYGGFFRRWLYSGNPQNYNSFGNGAAMRVSACGYVAKSSEEAKSLSHDVTCITHNHPEGLKGAEAVAVAIYLARTGKSILEIQDYITHNYYDINFTLDNIRETYSFDETCQGTVPQAIEAFFESVSFEDAIRNAISIGGDSDTIAAITGSIAEAYYGIPADLRNLALTFLDETLLSILNAFEAQFGIVLEKQLGDEATRPVSYISGRETIAQERQESMLNAIDTTSSALLVDETESKETTATKLFNHLYQACNILRGPIDQDDYKSYVIPILFFKRISDIYDEETADARQQYGDDMEFYTEAELHTFIIPNGCHWNDVRTTSEDVGKAIVDAMMGIERANPETLAGLFSSFDDANWTDKTKLSDERLKDLVEHMSSILVGNRNYSADIMGDAYEYLIKKFADMSKKNAGEFYTPRSVVKLMVRMLKPKSGDSVYEIKVAC